MPAPRRDSWAIPMGEQVSAEARVQRLNLLRAKRTHLEAQVEADLGGRAELARVDAELRELEPQVQALPGTAYLFRKRRARV